jgi:hypothetical protein
MFASLNFGNPGELSPESRDPATNIAANKAKVLEAVGMAGRELVEVHQVHGPQVHVVRRGEASHGAETTKADALVTDDPSRAVAIRVADCTPVLLASDDGRLVGAVHAGWRGVISGVLPRALDRMAELGADPSRLLAAIGPCISAAQFEIGPEVVAAFRERFGAATPLTYETGDGKGRADMQGALRRQLLEAGVTRVDVLARCTVLEPELFYSHRRDKGLTGRMMGVIGPMAKC